jgi:hypothetical protein
MTRGIVLASLDKAAEFDRSDNWLAARPALCSSWAHAGTGREA